MSGRVRLAILFLAAGVGAASGHTSDDPLPGPLGLRERIVDGRLDLSLQDVVRLALLNDTEVRIGRLSYESAELGVKRAHGAFDPMLSASYDWQRSHAPTTSELEGALTRNDLDQSGLFALTQRLPTATQLGLQLDASRYSTNSAFATVNPSFSSRIGLSLTQPILGPNGPAAVRAPVKAARRGLAAARSDIEALANTTAARAVQAAFAVILARERLSVLRQSEDLAEKSYQRDKRALELGALSPLDIHRSEAQVATRRSQVIQAELTLSRVEDQLRMLIGADLDDQVRGLPIVLPAVAAPEAPSEPLDQEAVRRQALLDRPELEALRARLERAEIDLSVARGATRPDVSLQGGYSALGVSGTVLDPDGGVTLQKGGLGGALDDALGLDHPTYRVGIQVRVPLPNRAAQADLGNARVARRSALYEIRRREQAIHLEVASAVNQLTLARESLAATELARDLSRKSLEAEERKYELGAQSIFFVLDAQTQLAQAELSYLQARVDLQLAATDLERATGALGKRWVGVLLPEAGR